MSLYENPERFGLSGDLIASLGDYFSGERDEPPAGFDHRVDENDTPVSLAIANGWVRIAGPEGHWWPVPVVEADNLPQAHRAALWMAENGLLTDKLSIDVGGGYKSLSDQSLDRYLRTGRF